MSYFDYLNRLRSLDHLIRTENTGTAAEAAERLGVSRRCLFNYLEMLKDFGAEVEFSRKQKTYQYKNTFDLHEIFL